MRFLIHILVVDVLFNLHTRLEQTATQINLEITAWRCLSFNCEIVPNALPVIPYHLILKHRLLKEALAN